MSTTEELESRDSFKTFEGLSMVMEFFSDGTLKDHFANRALHYDEDDVTSIMTQCLSGLQYMHSANFVHRDLKPENILVKKNTDGPYKWKVVIADFGLAKCFGRHAKASSEAMNLEESKWEDFLKTEQNQTHEIKAMVHTKHVVTRYYRAPEVSLLQQEHEMLTEIDIWSMGCIFGEILQMKPKNVSNSRKRRYVLFTGQADLKLEPDARAQHMRQYTRNDQIKIIESQQINQIFKLMGSPDESYIASIKKPNLRKWIQAQAHKPGGNLAEMFPDTASEGLELFRGMLQYDPNKRFTAAQCLAHPYLAPTAKGGVYNVRTSKPMVEDFELAQQLTDAQLRALVCQEIEHHNPDLLNREEEVQGVNVTNPDA